MVLLPHLITQQINNLIKVKKRPKNFIILHECTKIILIWLIVTKKWCAHQYRLFRPLFALSTLFGPKYQKIWKIKEIPGDIIILHQCTKNWNHVIFNSQNVMWIALQVILSYLCLLPNFWPKKSKFLKKRKKHLGISSFYTCIPKITIIWCIVPLKWCRQHYRLCLANFCPFIPFLAQN